MATESPYADQLWRLLRSRADPRARRREAPTKGSNMLMPSWYVVLTSASGTSIFATLGPYLTRELAEASARDSRLVHYRVQESESRPEHTPEGSEAWRTDTGGGSA